MCDQAKAEEYLTFAHDIYEDSPLPVGCEKLYENVTEGMPDRFVVYKTLDGRAVFTFKGTTSQREWLSDAEMWLVPNTLGKGHVHRGFLEVYESMRPQLTDVWRQVVDEDLKVVATGHSLGAGLATLFAYEYAPRCESLYLFGAPAVTADKIFSDDLDCTGIEICNIQNNLDPVCKFAPLTDYYPVGQVFHTNISWSEALEDVCCGLREFNMLYFHQTHVYKELLRNGTVLMPK